MPGRKFIVEIVVERLIGFSEGDHIIDHIFWMWQQKDLKTRLHQVGGPIIPFDYSGKNVTLDFKVGLGKLAPAVQLRDLLDTKGSTLCYTY